MVSDSLTMINCGMKLAKRRTKNEARRASARDIIRLVRRHDILNHLIFHFFVFLRKSVKDAMSKCRKDMKSFSEEQRVIPKANELCHWKNPYKVVSLLDHDRDKVLQELPGYEACRILRHVWDMRSLSLIHI